MLQAFGGKASLHLMPAFPYPAAHTVPLFLAPMAGVSESPFRRLCRRFGADILMSEFLSSEAIRRGIRKTLEGAEFEECERPLGIQIYGSDAKAMAEAAKRGDYAAAEDAWKRAYEMFPDYDAGNAPLRRLA